MDTSMMMGTSTASAAMASSTAMEMDMGTGDCKISMLANWYTTDACFISRDWHIRNAGQFAGSLIGIFLWVVLLECFRRLAREYDRKIVREHETAALAASEKGVIPPFRPTLFQQLVRSAFYCVQFGAAYLLMLLAMYYNIGVILIIFAGAYVGHFVASRDTVKHGDAVLKDNCC